MPMGDSDTDWGRPTRSFLYGPDKTKKTWWAARAADDGFNVVLIDGDDGSSIIKQLPIAARKRILVVDVVNTPSVNVFARFMASFMRGKPFLWDETAKNSITPATTRNKEHSYIYFDINALTMNEVVIIDSWTALAGSLLLEWARENNIDLTSVEKEGDQFSLMGYQSRFLDFTLQKIKTFPCHVICIGHETVYEKFAMKDGKNVMVEQRTQPFSSTGPHAKKIGANFSNILRFRKYSDVAFKIDTGGDASTMGGARQIPPKVYDWAAISPGTIFNAVGSKPENRPNLGAIWLDRGSEFQIPGTGKPNLVAVKPPDQQQVQIEAQPAVVNASSAKPSMSLLKNLKKA